MPTARTSIARALAVPIAFAACGDATAARGQGGAEVTATALFDEGRRLMAAGKIAEACPKLAESQRLGPSGGTLQNLAECYEKNGQTASAWAAWKSTAARANAAGKRDVEARALKRAKALEPALARLTIQVLPKTDASGLEVKRDGIVVGQAELGEALPIDPGPHAIEARAPHTKPWSKSVTVAAGDAKASVTVTLEPEDAPPAPIATVAPPPTDSSTGAPPPPAGAEEASRDGSSQRTIGLVVGGAGVVGVVVGSIFGLNAKSKNDQALRGCRTPTLCTQDSLSLTEEAKTAAAASTIAFGIGGAALVGGAVLYFTAPSSPAKVSAFRVSPTVGAGSAGVTVGGAF